MGTETEQELSTILNKLLWDWTHTPDIFIRGKAADTAIREVITLISKEALPELAKEAGYVKLAELKMLVLEAIADEPEYPDNMPNELWQELDGNKDNVIQSMRSTVRLTKNGITDRFLNSLLKQTGRK